MNDIVDQANDNIEREMNARLSARLTRGLEPNGSCHNCSEAVPDGRLFCDLECRDDLDRRLRREKRPA